MPASPTPVWLDDLAALPTGERDPVGIIAQQNATRLPGLVPVRMGRMLQPPFAYYRGTAAGMAADLATTPHSGVLVAACGDAHISNFGFFASPERRLLFDLNDFDEGGMAPWEWDLKRLVASVCLAALDNDEAPGAAWEASRKTARSYRRYAQRLAKMTALERFYVTVDASAVERFYGKGGRKRLAKTQAKARARTSERVLDTMTVAPRDGSRRIVEQPPLTTHRHLGGHESLHRLWTEYVRTTAPDVRYLLDGFRPVDFVLRVVGVGSVGTRCYIAYLEDHRGAPLFLQLKEAGESVLGRYGGIRQAFESAAGTIEPGNHGERVVIAQRILQSHSDPFLGWITGFAGDQGEHVRVDYFWRQFKDMKGSIDLARLNLDDLTTTAKVCAGILARAHSQSPPALHVAQQCTDGKDMDVALADFARGYAGIVRGDFEALKAAADAGDIPVEYGV